MTRTFNRGGIHAPNPVSRFALTCVLICLAIPAHAQLERIVESTHSYTDMCILDDTAYVVGTGVYASADGGRSWRTVPTPGVSAGTTFIAAAANDHNLFVLGTDSVLYRRNASAPGFLALTPCSGTQLLTSGNFVYATNWRRSNSDTTFLRSDDHGSTFTQIDAPQGSYIRLCYCEGLKLWATNGISATYYSSDAGESWRIIMPTSISCMIRYNGRYYAQLEHSPAVVRQSVDGISWSATQGLPQLPDVQWLTTGDGSLWAATERSIYRSNDPDVAWEKVIDLPYHFYRAVILHSADRILFLARFNSNIVNDSQLFGNSLGDDYWTLTGPGPNMDIGHLEATESALVLCNLGNGLNIASSDGGTTWCATRRGSYRPYTLTEFGDTLYAFSPRDAEGLGVYSTNRGATWHERPSGGLGYIEEITQDGDRMYTISRFVNEFKSTILSSGDRGMHWQTEGILTPDYDHDNNDVLALGDKRLAPSKHAGPTIHYWYSSDGGAHWSNLYNAVGESMDNMAYCANKLFAETDRELLVSTDDGTVWTSVLSLNPDDRLLAAVQNHLLVLSGGSIYLVRGTDYHVHTVSLTPILSDGPFRAWAVNSKYLYMSPFPGKHVWRLDVATAVTHAEYPQLLSPEAAITINALWPQPAAQGTPLQVEITLDAPGSVQLELFDLLGRRHAVRRRNRSVPGSQHFTLPTTGLRSGVYLLRLQSHQGMATRRVLISQ